MDALSLKNPVFVAYMICAALLVLKMAAKSPAATPDAALVNTYWKIVTLKGEAVPPAEGSREAHVVLREDQGLRYSATVGCNMVGPRSLPSVAVHPNGLSDSQFHLPRAVDHGVGFVRLVPGDQFGPMAGCRV